MLIVARATQDAVVAALGSLDADVGPTSPAGLTAVWCSGHAPISTLAGVVDLVALWDEPEHVVLHLRHDGRHHDMVWPAAADDDGRPAGERHAALVADLGRFFGAAATPALVEGLHRVACPDDLTELLVEHFDAPSLDPVRRRAVTLHRGRASAVRSVARLVTDAGQDVTLTDAGDDWTVLHADDPQVQQVVSLAAAATPGWRRPVVLHLWRGDGDAAGFELVHRRHVVAQGSWDDGWRRPGAEDWPARDAAAQLVARRVGGDVDLPALRSLLRARTRTGDPLARLVELLGLPSGVLDVLDGTGAGQDAPGNPACLHAS